jgi:hypothetical protein
MCIDVTDNSELQHGVLVLRVRDTPSEVGTPLLILRTFLKK